MNVCTVCELWLYGKAQNLWVRCHGQCSAVLFILMSRLLLYSAVSGVNRVQVVLSGFSVRFFSRQKLYVCMVVCIS